MKDNEVIAYCDGSGHKDGRGGWGLVLVYADGSTEEMHDAAVDTTNNKMELTGAIRALESTYPEDDLTVITDSQYVINGITEWIDGWIRARWRTSSNQPVKNVELWQRLHQLVQGRDVTWQWVKGHSGVPYNERADELAALGSEEAKHLKSISRSRYD